MKVPPYLYPIKITTMEKFSFQTRCAINKIVIDYISQPEDELMDNKKESDFVAADSDELIGMHLLTPHLN